MTDTSPIEQSDEHLLQSALEFGFQPADIPKSAVSPPTVLASSSAAPAPVMEITDTSESVEEDAWKAEYEAQVDEWRAQSAEARIKAERERMRWEQVRKREAEERQALGQEPENWDALGSHITSSFAAASEVLASSSASLASPSLTNSRDLTNEEGEQGSSSHLNDPQHVKMDSGPPSQKWEHINSSPTSSYPSMSFPGPSIPPSPSPPLALLPQTIAGHGQPQQERDENRKSSTVPPSTIPSLLDNTIAPRTRLSLLLSSLAINLLLPFVNGVMLGFGEIFAKNVLVGWIGWRNQSGRTAANVGIRR